MTVWQAVKLGEMFQLWQISPGKFMALEVGPVGQDTVTRIFCVCVTFYVPLPRTGLIGIGDAGVGLQ